MPTETQAFKFSVGGKKTSPQVPVENENIEDDEDYIDRNHVNLADLPSKEFKAQGVVDDVGVFRIKSILQNQDAVFKVNHVGLKQYYIFFNKGQTLSDEQIVSLVKTAGFSASDIKVSKVAAKVSAGGGALKE